ncbi:hypothetical protein GCM10025867_13910 [Frondihabitans sucicola]|uniref:Uncharacterized protein n=1 Tax=Frondihabitans sucicola TaxID=1268041 RepID=A0ABM8GL83_9MICO|nr:hypothetical protein GCM10025867_13910 [Frondihabitans sucicola]
MPAHGLASSSHGVGHLWKGDNFSWIGSYRMDDGRLGFCLEAGRPSPIGNDYSTSLTTQVAGTTPEETARLAWIARTYAATTSRDDAAAAQLAVWTITGLNGHTQEYYAARANERAAFVLQRAKAILADADTKATMTASARMTLQLDERGTARITGDILTTAPGGSPTVLPSGQHAGSTKLVGATLPDGKTSGSVKNGEPVAITPDTSKPEMQVRADVTFTDLPFGREVYVGTSPSRSQGLLFSAGGRATVTAHDTKKALSPRPFQPRVETQTSAAQAKPGALLVDRLEVSVAQGPGLLPEWGRYRSGESLAPIPVTVTSRLLGPFVDPIAPAPAWPDEPPTVCTVSTVFASGPAKATTPPCRVPAPGYYVWVETIDPADTPSDKGRDRVRPWKSPFGTASEVTFSPKSIAVQTRVRDEQLDAGSCAVDELDVSGFSQIAEGEHPEVDVESLLLGPFAEPVSDGRDLSDIDSSPSPARR